MANKFEESELQNLPVCAVEFIRLVIKKMRYRKKVRADVMAELAAHFQDELRDCKTDEEKQQKSQQLIEQFGDAKLLGTLLRRAKKRCRPIWRTVIARTFQTIGILILCFIIYAVWFINGKPTVSIDYLSLLNNLNQTDVLDEDNAWSHYEKAIELFVEPPEDINEVVLFKNLAKQPRREFSSLTQIQQDKFRKWNNDNEAAWQKFSKGSSRKFCSRKYGFQEDDNENWLFGVILPHLKPLLSLASLGIWRARMHIEQGDTKQGLEDCLVVARAGSHWEGKACLIEHIVGLGISKLAHKEILHIAATQTLQPKELAQLQQQISQIYPQGYSVTVDVEGERLMFLDMVQHVFTDGGPGGGHLTPRGMQELQVLDGGVFDRKGHALSIYLCTPVSMLHARRDETVTKANEMYDELSKLVKMSPYEIHIHKVSEESIIENLPEYKYFSIRTFVPAVKRISQYGYESKATHEAVITILALRRFQLVKGLYPATLRELVEGGYIKEIPDDPYSDKPLIYKKTDSDFLLYSVGHNFEDDGGQVYRDEEGKIELWAEEGDAVFWPVQK